MSDASNATETVCSKAQIKITVDESTRIVTIEIPQGPAIVVNGAESSVSVTDAHQNSIRLSSSGIAINSAADLSIKAAGTVSIEGHAVGMTSDTSLKAQAQQISLAAGSALDLKGTATASLTSSGEVTVQAAMVMIN